jgi:hypothetical protein
MVADVDYISELERAYSGTGDAVYTARSWRDSVPGTVVSSTYTSVGAPEQTQYNVAKWMIADFSGTNKIISCSIELLN